MQYLQDFNRRLRQWRVSARVPLSTVAAWCEVDERLVQAWEVSDAALRLYPGLDELLNLCLASGTQLANWLDLPGEPGSEQFMLPGVTEVVVPDDVSTALERLREELDRSLPSAEERELLRRFRRSSQENRQLIIQLMS